jgi:hypothetical protein
MGRLEQIQQKKLRNTIILYIVILILILYFIFTYGIKLLLNSSSYIAGLYPQPSTKPLAKNEDSFSSLDVNNIPTATNSARFNVSGSVLNFDILDFFINNKQVKEINLTADTFSEEIGELEKGDNFVYLLARSKDNKTQKNTITYKVFYNKEKPKLDISEPADNSTTNNQEINIKGSTEKEIYIRVNDLPIVVDANGGFQTTVRLKDGDNQIVITAQDISGNLETKSLKVTYQKE